MTYYVYGAEGSRTTDKVETLLTICRRQYKLFILGQDYSIEQLEENYNKFIEFLNNENKISEE